MDVFKGEIGGLNYYFKPKGDNEYLMEPYKHKTRPFKITSESKDTEGSEKKVWSIPVAENVPDGIRNLETDFSNLIEEMRNQSK
jgi:hypothetical protein